MYVQVAVAIETENLERKLNRLREKMVLPDAPVSGAGEIVKCIAEIYEKCRSRCFEKTVLPVMTNTGKISRDVLDQFRVCRNGISEMYFILTCFPWKPGNHAVAVKHRIAAYTGLVEELINEREVFLFEQAKTVLSDEDWFKMAESIMEEDVMSLENDGNGFGFRDNPEWTYSGNRFRRIVETEYRL